MDKKVLIAWAVSAAMTMSANAESNNTSPEFNQENASKKVEVVKKSVCDKTNLALACHKAGLVLPQEEYVENQNNVETAESMIDFSELEKSSDVFSDVMFPNKDQLFTVSEDSPAELTSISDIRELYSNILMSRSTDRSPAWDALFEKLEASEDKTLFIDFINKSVQNIKENHGDVEWIPTNVPQIYLEKSITASISALLNMPKEQTVIDWKVSEFTLRYLTDLTTALYLKGDIQESDIQVINNNGAYFATFAINEQTVSTLLDATQGKYSPLAVLQSMQTVGENLQEEEISLAGISLDYIKDVEKYTPEVQKLFMEIFNKYAPELEWQDLDDLHYELTGTFNAVDNNPSRAIEDAEYVVSTFGWDLSKFIEYAENAKIAQDERLTNGNQLIEEAQKRNELKDEQIARKDEQIANDILEIENTKKSIENAKKILAMLNNN